MNQTDKMFFEQNVSNDIVVPIVGNENVSNDIVMPIVGNGNRMSNVVLSLRRRARLSSLMNNIHEGSISIQQTIERRRCSFCRSFDHRLDNCDHPSLLNMFYDMINRFDILFRGIILLPHMSECNTIENLDLSWNNEKVKLLRRRFTDYLDLFYNKLEVKCVAVRFLNDYSKHRKKIYCESIYYDLLVLKRLRFSNIKLINVCVLSLEEEKSENIYSPSECPICYEETMNKDLLNFDCNHKLCINCMLCVLNSSSHNDDNEIKINCHLCRKKIVSISTYVMYYAAIIRSQLVSMVTI